MGEFDIEKYTTLESIEELSAVEAHLKRFTEDILFCRECLIKHISHLRKLGSECTGACELDSSLWPELESWAAKAVEEIPNLDTEEQAIGMSQKARDFRKRLEKSWLETLTKKGKEEYHGGHIS